MNDKKKSTVLVVDDSRVGLTHLVNILQDDYILHTAASGVEAIQSAKAIIPDLILMDIVMPQMDGYEAMTTLKNSLETRDIPVIFITSLDQDGNEEKGLLLGAVDYISKPYNPTIVKLRVSLQLRIINQMKMITELSLMDTVTKLPNRHYFSLRLRDEWERAKSENRMLGLILMDVDKLRSYNAIYGFNQGDAGLIAIADIITRETGTQPGNIAARWADDGFAALIQNADIGVCNTISDDIRREIEKTDVLTADGEKTNFTVSIGANAINFAVDNGDFDKFIANADAALYLAKELGRNQVVAHS